jgi:hypothetical protein
VLSFAVAACSPESDLEPFRSDGCSLFPDHSVITRDDWCACCLEHDLAYWRGGTRAERERADARLQECVFAKTGDEHLARLMYEGVRFGGSPYFYNWYRWGYGWPYDRKYQALTANEAARAARMLEQAVQSAVPNACSR